MTGARLQTVVPLSVWEVKNNHRGRHAIVKSGSTILPSEDVRRYTLGAQSERNDEQVCECQADVYMYVCI